MKIYHSRRYKVNERFFSYWTPAMAYVLGFWFADGYMRIDKSYRISFSSKDKDILRSILQVLKSNHPIKPHSGDCWQFTLHSKHMYFDLALLGGKRCKSKIITFPQVPIRFLRDFIRGYFDGDGSVFFVEYTRTKDKKLTRELRTNFTSGSRKFLESLMVILNKKLNLSLKKLGVFNNGGSLKLGYGMRDSDALLRYMYYDKFPIGLERKAIFVSRIPDYQRHTSNT